MMSRRLFGRILLPVMSNVVPRRTVAAATNARQLSESTAVKRDARQFVKMLRQDGLLDGLIIGFVGIFGFVQYTVFLATKEQPRDIIGLPKVGEQGYEHSDFKRDL